MPAIDDHLALFGFAPVLAFTRPTAAARAGDGPAPGADDLSVHFTPEPNSQLAAAAAAAASTEHLLTERRDSATRVSRGTARPAPERPSPGAEVTSTVRVYPHLGVTYGTVDRAGLAALQADPRVAKVSGAPQVSLIRPRAGDPGVKRRMRSWGLDAAGIRELWAEGLSGAGITVAHLDTGVDASHPALAGAIGEYAEFDLSGLPVAGAPAHDSDLIDGHGTHTAAIIAGRKVGRRQVGVAPAAELHSAMVIEGGDMVARILAGMDWAVAHRVRVLSLSLGLRGYRADFIELIAVLRDNGVLPVIAVGNEGPNTSRSPGNYPNALSVGYHDVSMAVDPGSSSQRFPLRAEPLVPDVVAPGTDILSAVPGGGWKVLSGSSMAVPHVAGLAALLFEAMPEAGPDKVEAAIYGSATLGTMDPDRCNRGAIHGLRALELLRGE